MKLSRLPEGCTWPSPITEITCFTWPLNTWPGMPSKATSASSPGVRRNWLFWRIQATK
ncbi:hypothetical protein D3C84_856700 [compost metagenome]